MMRHVLAAALLCCVLLPAANLFAQQGNGQVSGVVEDGTKALIPGVTVTLTNTQTGVSATRLTNEAGVYDFQTVQPGEVNVE